MSFRFPPPGLAAAPEVEVFPATAFRVRLGVNMGDPLGADTVAAGDIYRLEEGARPALIRLTPPGSAAVTPQARACHLFLAEDGRQTEVVVLHGATQGDCLLMPLSPLCPGLDYALIRTAPAPPHRLPVQPSAGIVRGSRILRADGTPCPVEELRPGDLILTRDHGAQPLRWAGLATLRAIGPHAPIAIAPGTFGNAGELRVGAPCRLFRYRRPGDTPAAQAGLLVEARHLAGRPGVAPCEGGFTDYAFLVFDAHEVIYAEGIAVESLHVTPPVLDRLPGGLAEEIRIRFPGQDQPCHFGRDLSAATRQAQPQRA